MPYLDQSPKNGHGLKKPLLCKMKSILVAERPPGFPEKFSISWHG